MRAVSSIAALGILSAFGGVAPPHTEYIPRTAHSHGNGGRGLRRRRARNKIASKSRAANRR